MFSLDDDDVALCGMVYIYNEVLILRNGFRFDHRRQFGSMF